jgi:hypothetical protein
MFRVPTYPSSSPSVTVTGFPSKSHTAREQVASKPMPLMASGGVFELERQSLTQVEMASQILSVDCSYTVWLLESRKVMVSFEAEAIVVPFLFTNNTLAELVPTSIPMYALLSMEVDDREDGEDVERFLPWF